MSKLLKLEVIVPWRPDGGRRDLIWRWCEARWRAFLPGVSITTVDSGDEPFNRSASRNRGVEDSEADVVILADADVAVGEMALRKARTAMKKFPWAAPFDWFYTLSESFTDTLLSLPPTVTLVPDQWIDRLPPVPQGCIVVHRSCFERVRYDERFIGWGYEDNLYAEQMTTAFGFPVIISGPCVHLDHGYTPRFDQPFIEHNRALYEERSP